MSTNLLAISVGNTRTQMGVYTDGKLHEQRWLSHDQARDAGPVARELFEPVRGAADVAVYLASVNDPVATVVHASVSDALSERIWRVDQDVNIPIGRQLDREAIVGEDRLLNAAAAYDRAKQAVAIVDVGTAVTVDFVDGAGTFQGGAILPGSRLMIEALHAHTAALPQIEMARPQEPIGHNTVEAIRSGVFHGIRGAVRELVEKYAEVYQGYPRVVATGGDAELLFRDYDLIEAIVPDLTLLGMVVGHRCAMEEE